LIPSRMESIDPARTNPCSVIAVPTLELLLSGLWLLRIERKYSYRLSLCMLLTFVTAICTQLAVAKVPDCGCFGLVDRWLKDHAGNWVILTRSVGMTLVLLLALVISGNGCTNKEGLKGSLE